MIRALLPSLQTLEYIEYFESQYINKKHNGIKKSEKSMNLESFAAKINSLSEIEDNEKTDNETIEQGRFTVKKNEMVLETVEKKKFSQLNNKRYYFQCGIVLLPFSHPHLEKINQYKWYKKQRIENWFLKEKDMLKKLEKEAVLKNHRLSALCANDIENINFSLKTRRYILGASY